jgi:hypothetical protein
MSTLFDQSNHDQPLDLSTNLPQSQGFKTSITNLSQQLCNNKSNLNGENLIDNPNGQIRPLSHLNTIQQPNYGDNHHPIIIHTNNNKNKPFIDSNKTN